jgi:hypothetical protein
MSARKSRSIVFSEIERLKTDIHREHILIHETKTIWIAIRDEFEKSVIRGWWIQEKVVKCVTHFGRNTRGFVVVHDFTGYARGSSYDKAGEITRSPQERRLFQKGTFFSGGT